MVFDVSCHFVAVFVSISGFLYTVLIVCTHALRHRPVVTIPSILLGYAERISPLGNSTLKPFYV